jgi:N utilization substance protein B
MTSAPASGPPGRARGRELALWMLSHLESAAPGRQGEAVELFLRQPPQLDPADDFLAPHADELGSLIGDRAARRWAARLVDAYVLDGTSIDAQIEAVSQRWRLERMDRVDRNLLRLCTVELLRETTPRNVVVAEAVRLAARYGSERSPTFVNGLAETLARTIRDVAATSTPEQAQPELEQAEPEQAEPEQAEPEPEQAEPEPEQAEPEQAS